MAEVVYPFKLAIVSSLPQASNFTNRMVVYDNKVYFSDGTQWIELGSGGGTSIDYKKFTFFLGD